MEITRYDESYLDPQTKVGFLQQNSVRETAPLHTHDFFEIFLVSHGKALHLVNQTVQPLEAGDLVLIRPADVHCYDFYSSYDFRLINIAFPLSTMTAVSELLLPQTPLAPLLASPLPPSVKLTPQQTAEAAGQLAHTAWARDNISPQNAYCYFRSLLAFLLCRYFFSGEMDRPAIPDWLAAAVAQMRSIENFRAGLPRFLALAHCSEEHLCREFKKHYHTTPLKFVNAQRLHYSLYLLSNTGLEIVEVAAQCGFQNLSHFYHLFRAQFGTSPGKYRAQSP